MINAPLHRFIDRVIDNKAITADDVRDLQRIVLQHGITSRAEADALLALDRILDCDTAWGDFLTGAVVDYAAWGDFLTAAIVDYAVWGSRPTGRVTTETAAWLLTAFTCGEPTDRALRIAREIVAEAQEVDADLLLFARRGTTAYTSLAA